MRMCLILPTGMAETMFPRDESNHTPLLLLLLLRISQLCTVQTKQLIMFGFHDLTMPASSAVIAPQIARVCHRVHHHPLLGACNPFNIDEHRGQRDLTHKHQLYVATLSTQCFSIGRGSVTHLMTFHEFLPFFPLMGCSPLRFRTCTCTVAIPTAPNYRQVCAKGFAGSDSQGKA